MEKGLHYLLVADHFLYQRRLFPSRLRLCPKHHKCLPGDKSRHQEGKRCDQYYHARDAHIDTEHKAQRAEDRDNTCKELRKSHQQAVRKLVHVRDHPAHHFPVGVFVNIFQRQDLDALKRLVPDILHDTVSHLVVTDIHDPLGRCRDSDHHRHLS